jgi:tetratricopeptide (TPR) repeat protein
VIGACMSIATAGGAIVTFYSYKGGVGRTMALANIAVQLARKGNRVLMADWDLEAPDLVDFFIGKEAQQSAKVSVTPATEEGGLLALLTEGHDLASGDINSLAWRRKIIRLSVPPDPSTYSNPTPPSPGPLDLLASGYGSKNYSTILADFSWKEFFAKQRGGEWLEKLRNEWSANYEFILIDSRTGLTDSGGVCTVQMPDFLVFVFTADDRSLTYGLKVLAAIQQARQSFAFERGPLAVIPLLSRWDSAAEVDLADTWMKRLSKQIGGLTSLWLPKDFEPREFLEKTRVRYVPRFSFGESLPTLTSRLTDLDLPGLPYDTIARLLHARLSNAGSIIDPSYTQPLVSAGPAAEDEAALLTLVSDPIVLNRQIGQLSRTHGDNSAELTSFLGRASSKLHQLARFSEAEPLMRRALAIDEKSFGPDHPDVAIDLNNLAALLQSTNRLGEAEPMYRRALAIDEKSYGPDHPNVAIRLNNLASLLKAANRLGEAEPLMHRALAIDEKSFGPDHPDVAIDLNNLALLLKATNRLTEAEPLMRRALAIDEKGLGPEHPNVAIRLSNLAQLLQATDRLAEAEPLMRRAVEIFLSFTARTGHEHPHLQAAFDNYFRLLRAMGRTESEARGAVAALISAHRPPPT